MKQLALAVAILATITAHADAKCAKQQLAAEVLPDAPNGAIVAITSANWDDARTDDTSAWKLRANGKDIAPVITVLAPGLSVYRLPKGVASGELTDGTTTLAKVSATAAKPLPAPKVKVVTHSQPGPRERKGSSRTTVSITGSAPADAVALVITDASGKALSFGRVEADGDLEPYYHGRCGVLPNGTIEPQVGQSVRLFWVDKYGQPSAKSAAIKVVKAP